MDVKVKDVKDTGVFTQEGNVSGSRAASLTKQRQKQREEFEQKKAELEGSKDKVQLKSVNDRFKKEIVGGESNSKAYGLKTREEFLRIQAEEKNHDAKALEALKEQEERMAARVKRKKKKKASQQRKKSRMMLSFNTEEDEEDIEQETEKSATDASGIDTDKKVVENVVTKNPDVRTDFLPDRKRDEDKAKEIERLKKEWLEKQIALKKEMVEITYSYWDGSGHRRTITVPKGSTIGEFLEKARQDLAKDFFELRKQNGSDLMYVKEDIIIPSDISFYDLIVTKARGKSGPLFHFDVHDDIRLVNDARIEKDESHPGKVCERSWYEKSKHIFPASRWEAYDPDKTYSKYTIK